MRSLVHTLSGYGPEAILLDCRRELRAKSGAQARKILTVDECRLEQGNDDDGWALVLDTADFGTLTALDYKGFEGALLKVVRSAVVTLDEYALANANTTQLLVGGVVEAIGQSFPLAGPSVLTGLTFSAAKFGSPPGYVYGRVYEATGTHGTDATPTGDPLVEIAVLASSLSAYPTLAASVFLIDDLRLDAGTYVSTISYDDGADPANSVLVGIDSTSPTHAGNASRLVGGSWSTSANDLVFVVSGSRILTPSTRESRYRLTTQCTTEYVGSEYGTGQVPDVFRSDVRVFSHFANAPAA